MTIKSLHAKSGIIVGIFITLHLFNHVLSIFGSSLHLETMRNLRLVYRNPIVEAFILIAVAVQVISGVKLWLAKRKSSITIFETLQIWSGLYLAVFFLIHLSAIFIARLYLKLDTNFYFGVAGVNSFPYNIFFIPYYGLAIMSVFTHVASLHRQKMKHSILRISPVQQSLLIIISGLIITLIIFYGATNHFKGAIIPTEYKMP